MSSLKGKEIYMYSLLHVIYFPLTQRYRSLMDFGNPREKSVDIRKDQKLSKYVDRLPEKKSDAFRQRSSL